MRQTSNWALEAWRRRYGRYVRVWLRVVGEFEALASLAAYAYEHPADPFPELVPLESAPGAAAPAMQPATSGSASRGKAWRWWMRRSRAARKAPRRAP